VLERTAEAALLPEPAAIALSAMLRHKRRYGVYPNFLRPKTFNEKVLHRIVFDRRPILTTLQDKYAVRDYVKERVGDHVLPRLFWVTKNPADIPFDKLPNRFVVKATHGCGFVYLVPDKACVDRKDVIAKCVSWLNSNYYNVAREWAYKRLERRIIVEEFISDGTGLTPMDYKCYVFGGRVQMIQVETRQFGDLRQDRYGRSWDRLDLTGRYKPIGGVPRPDHLDGLIGYAEMLGDGLDFLRVDLYDAGKVFFGEMTLYPAAGLKTFVPEKWNRYFGDLWDLSTRTAGDSHRTRPMR
jgi:TupA-like ATPgrasp